LARGARNAAVDIREQSPVQCILTIPNPNNNNSHVELTYEDIYEQIEKESGVDFRYLWEMVSDIKKEFMHFNDELIIELSVTKSKDQFKEQINLLDKLENFIWGYASIKFIKNRQPQNYMADYRTAQKIMTKGLDTPPHIAYSANVFSMASEVMALQDHMKLVYRILRELELILEDNDEVHINDNTALSNLDRIFDRFHKIASQLVNRHNGKPTLVIEDEYDVQDLLRSILTLYFDDIRPEDYTPSYAGRNTRVDFLLKKHRIIIEVKKTRNTLKDKGIGDELLQDIARYKNHPDCDILYCFVYDPSGLISNPRGLESDLNSESNDTFKVITKIRP